MTKQYYRKLGFSLFISIAFFQLKAQKVPELISVFLAEDYPSNVETVQFNLQFNEEVSSLDIKDLLLVRTKQLTKAEIAKIILKDKIVQVIIEGIDEHADGYLRVLPNYSNKPSFLVSPDFESEAYYAGAAFDVSRINDATDEVGFYPIGLNEGYLKELEFSSDGRKCFMINIRNNTIVAFNIYEPFNLSSANFSATNESLYIGKEEPKPQRIVFSPDGMQMFVMGATYSRISAYAFDKPFDLSSAHYEVKRSLDLSSLQSKPFHLHFNLNGDHMFIMRKNSDSVFIAKLNEPYNISTAKFVPQSGRIEMQRKKFFRQFHFSPDGFRAFTIGSNKTLNEYHLTSAYDLRTAQPLDENEGFALNENSRIDFTRIAFNGDGTQLFIAAYNEITRGVFALELDAKPIVIRDLQLGVHYTRNGMDSIAFQPSPRLDELTFDQNNVQFTFQANGEIVKDSLKFRVFLEGEDESFSGWNYARVFEYNNLRPGHYIFQIQGQNIHQQRSEILLLPFTIHSPWYLTWWAFVVYALFSGFVVWLIVFINQRRLLKRNRELESVVIERTQQISDKMAEIEEQAAKLKALDKVKTRFFANISHELRTPITLINGPLEALINDDQISNGQVERTAKIAKKNGDKLLGLVEEILTLSKLEAGKFELINNPVRVKELFELSLENYREAFNQKNVDLIFLFGPPSDLTMMSDKKQLSKIINNLLSNALKFTEQSGKVVLSVQLQNSKLSIKVEDSGQGIHPHDLPHVFDRYFQSSIADKKALGGTGIGLSLVKELVTLFGGNIGVESSLGTGTKFLVELPVQEVNEQILTPAKEGNANVLEYLQETIINYNDKFGTEKPVLLITEDHPEMRSFIAKTLSPYFEVLEAKHGKEALGILNETAVDIVISDLMMPVMDGFELLDAIKKDARLHSVSLIMLTARADEESRLQALTMGIDDYLTKPFSTSIFLARIKNILDNRIKVIREMQDLLDPTKLEKLQGFIALHDISDRELEILKCMAKRLGNQEIAQTLGISVNTVKYHLKKLYFKLEINSRSELNQAALEVIS